MSTFYCVECHGSGERDMQGFLDCQAPGCNAAVERAALDAHLLALGRLHERDLVWEAYKLGQAKAIPAIVIDNLRAIARSPEAKAHIRTMAAQAIQALAPANNNTEKADDR